MFYGFKSNVFSSPGRPKTLYFTCPGLRKQQKMLISAPGAGDPPGDPKSAESPPTRCPHICRLDARRGALKRPPSRATFRRSDAPSLRRCDTQASTPQSSRLVWVVRRTVVPSHVVPSLRGSVVPLGAAGLTSTKETPLSETELRESLSLLISSKTQDPGAKDSRHKAKAQDPGAKAHDRRAQARKAGAKAQDPRAKAQEPRAEVEDRDLKPKTAEVKPRDNWIPVEPRNRSPAARKSPL